MSKYFHKITPLTSAFLFLLLLSTLSLLIPKKTYASCTVACALQGDEATTCSYINDVYCGPATADPTYTGNCTQGAGNHTILCCSTQSECTQTCAVQLQSCSSLSCCSSSLTCTSGFCELSIPTAAPTPQSGCLSQNQICEDALGNTVGLCCISQGLTCSQTSFVQGVYQGKTCALTVSTNCVGAGQPCEDALGNTVAYCCPNQGLSCEKGSWVNYIYNGKVCSTCGAEGDPCCPTGNCDPNLTCSNNNICVRDAVNTCDQYCSSSSFSYGVCGSYSAYRNITPQICARPPSPNTMADCNINGSPYDCFCCNQYITSVGGPGPIGPASTITPIEQKIFCTGPHNQTATSTDTGYILTGIGCLPANDLQNFVTTILPWSISIAGGIAVMLIIYAGFLISTSQNDPRRLNSGRELLTAAISGLLLLVFGAFLLRFLGQDILRIPGF